MPVRLEVVCHTEHGDCLGVTGEAAALGAWSLEKALRFDTDADSYPKWTLQMPALPAGSEFKLILFKADGQDVTWEGFWHNRRWPHNPVLNRLVTSPFTIVLQGTFGLDHLTILNAGSMQAWDASSRIKDQVVSKGDISTDASNGGTSDKDVGEQSDDGDLSIRSNSIASLERHDSIGQRSVGNPMGRDIDEIGRKNIFPIEEEFAAEWDIDAPPSMRGRGLEFDPVMVMGGRDGVPGACSKACFEGVYRILQGLPERPDGEKGEHDEAVDLEFLRGS
eukprot:CAMPEP_0178444538 /NCGR_PEP_ID=MMETSP0689_2-20121128/39579_1 /TAXON_ID=160604 /ORGANISM="Amphidinium massartii, Strain CS-259" /LENGTH=277 /DNA_ID=CAMNT_0020068813 /DNA_START=56 /DNA_END=889 /DNA_ORIENTATION=+